MAPSQSAVKLDREKRVKSTIAFATSLPKRFEDKPDTTLYNELLTHIRGLPLPASPSVMAKQVELDRLGTELWNLSSRMQRDEPDDHKKDKEHEAHKVRSVRLLRVFAFLMLDSAKGQAAQAGKRKGCIRLMKVALRAAKDCIEGKELAVAVKVLERAAEYESILSTQEQTAKAEEHDFEESLRIEYYTVRVALAWREDRLDMAEHMYTKCKQRITDSMLNVANNLADLCFEIGKDTYEKQNFDMAVRWLEHADDVLGEQDSEMLNPDLIELRLSTKQYLVQVYRTSNTPETQDKAWQMIKLLETEYGDKMVVLLLKIDLLMDSKTLDATELYNVILKMIRTVVLSDRNFKTIVHCIHKLKDHNIGLAGKALEDLIEIRLFREENQKWIEKAMISKLWLSTTHDGQGNILESLQELFDSISQNLKVPLTAPATHAAQTLLWKRIEALAAQGQHDIAEEWCLLSLHPILDKAGAQNKAKISRKIIQCALTRHDYRTAQAVYDKMPESGREEPVTGYLMYKASLHGGDAQAATNFLDLVCRNSAKDATLLYACVMEAQSAGDRRQAVSALQKLLEKYDHATPSGIHLPALLRSTARLLQQEMLDDGKISNELLGQLCTVFESASSQAKASRRRPATPAQQLFTPQEFEWFSKNTYNLALKYCAEMNPANLARLLNSCIAFIKLFKDTSDTTMEGDLCLRMVFCEYLAVCTYSTLARAEDNVEKCLQHYLDAQKHSQEFRRAAAEGIDKLGGSAQADIISKYFQIVKLELEAVLKLEKWEELDDLFDQCWKYKSPDHYETLADLVIVINSCITDADVDAKYRKKILSVLYKIINLTCRQSGSDIVKLSRWLRCYFAISLKIDEDLSLKSVEQVTHIAAKKQGNCFAPIIHTTPPSSSPAKPDDELNIADITFKEADQYPQVELEWLATTIFNRAVDCFMQENDEKTKLWAEKSFVVAQWMDDDGRLRDRLMNIYSTLNFDRK